MPNTPYRMRSDFGGRPEAEKSFVEYTGTICAETNASVGFASEANPRKVEFWIPKKVLGIVTYHDGDDNSILIGRNDTARRHVALEGFFCAEWFAKKEGLL